jgi:hypothetical protein
MNFFKLGMRKAIELDGVKEEDIQNGVYVIPDGVREIKDSTFEEFS